MQQSHVQVARNSVKRAWKASGYDDFWLRLRTDQDVALERIEAAGDAANDAASADPDLETRCYAATPCPGGFAVEIGPVLNGNHVEAWVDHFAQALARLGVSGSLGGAPQACTSKIITNSPPVPTLFTRFRLAPTIATAPGSSPDGVHWEVGAAQTRAVLERTVDWARTGPGKVTLSQGSFDTVVGDLDLVAALTRALRGAGYGGLDVVDGRTQRARRAVLGPWAEAAYQAIGMPGDEMVDELRDLAIKLPPPLDYAFIRNGRAGLLGLTEINGVQPLPGIREPDVRYNPHLRDRYLPDAHGIQIVTDAHLHAAHDLSAWTITDLGEGRHLVEAPDLAPWYGAPLPDPDVLARARADWAGALLTLDVIEAHPFRPA